MKGYELVAMYANTELYARMKGWDVTDEYETTVQRSEDPYVRNEDINKDFKKLFGQDIKSFLRPDSEKDSWEVEEDIIELS